MIDTPTLSRLLWGVTFSVNAGLVLLLLYRKNHRVFPLFFLYVLLDFLHGVIVFGSYRIWGFDSYISFRVAWGTEGLVIVGRALAVAEICRRVLAAYRGIWELAWRMFLVVGGMVLAYALAVGGHSWRLVAVTADRSLELAIAVTILALFVFAHYYEIVVESAAKLMSIGFFLYSCFQVLNDTVLEGWLSRYATLWNLFGTFAFLASLLLWMWALRTTQEPTMEPSLLPVSQYQALSPVINTGLKALNEELSHFWHPQGRKT